MRRLSPTTLGEIRAALDRLARGERLTKAQSTALERGQRALGSNRPISEYAPRTQRRYLGALERGESARDANQRQSLRQRIEHVRREIYDRLVENENHTREAIRDYVTIYGERQVLDALTSQLEVIDLADSGDASAGRRRIMAYRKTGRGALVALPGNPMIAGEYEDPLFWYRTS